MISPGVRTLALFGAQVVLNVAWSYAFFARQLGSARSLGNARALLAAGKAISQRSDKIDPVADGVVLPFLAWAGLARLVNDAVIRHHTLAVATAPEGEPADADDDDDEPSTATDGENVVAREVENPGDPGPNTIVPADHEDPRRDPRLPPQRVPPPSY